MHFSVLVSFCWRVSSSSFPYFDLFLLFFNDFDYRFLDIYLKKSSEVNDVIKKIERPNQTNQNIMADDFDTKLVRVSI